MTQVIDASALVLMHTDLSAQGDWARRLIDEGELFAPALVQAEATNALRRMEYRGALSPQAIESALMRIFNMNIALREFEPYVRRVWELRHNATAYDAWYVAIAEDLGCRLVTGDWRLGSVPGVRCEIVTPPRS